MKRLRLLFALCFLIIPIIASITIMGNFNKQETNTHQSNFVSIDNGKFDLSGKQFFPMMINYIINFREIDNKIIVSPSLYYDSINKFDAHNPKEIENRLNAHFELISELGFNTIRLIGIDRLDFDEETNKLVYSYGAYNKDNKKTVIPILEQKKNILDALERLVKIADKHHLRLMILLPQPHPEKVLYNSQRLNFIRSILHKFADEPNIFAYDFFNEPLYFDNHPNDIKKAKQKKYVIVSFWKKLMQRLAPHQLFTIGYSEPIETFRWDPSVLPVDFISFHSYSPLRVPNEIYWYSHFTNKPWIISEIGLPADNDSIPYLLQKQFMKEALRRTVNCGGIGFGWWQFQDEPAESFEARYSPLLNHKGITKTRKGNYTIYGSLKPAAYEIKHFIETYKPTYDCPCENNYYNMMGYENYLIKGKVINKKTEKPVHGAVIRGWNQYWSIGQNTYSRKDGSFTLFSNDECVHFEISAPGMQTIKFDAELNYKTKNGSSDISNINLKDKSLEYQDIDFRNLLKYKTQLSDSTLYEEKDKIIFNFNDALLHNYKLVGEMGTKKLKDVNFKY